MFAILFLLIAGWLFYRLAWSYDKNTWKSTFLGIAIYSLLLFSVSYVLSFLISMGTEIPASNFLLIHLQLLLSFRFNLLTNAFTFIPVAIIFFLIYKVIEYRWKQQETNKPIANREVLD